MLNLKPLEVPLILGSDGALRIRGIDVTLEEVIGDFEDGVIADEIVFRHSGLALSDVFLVISFYLKNRKEVEVYLANRQRALRLAKANPAA